jgi:hypothetical protein
MANSSTTMKMMVMMMMMMVVTMMQGSFVEGQTVDSATVPMLNITELPSDANVTTTTNVDQIAIRVLYNDGKASTLADGNCTASDLAMIQSTALNMIYNLRDRHLRRRSLSGANPPAPQRQLMPGWCYTVCRGFVTGKCQVIYPACDDWRRGLGASTYVHDATDTPAVDPNYSDNGSFDQDDERKLWLTEAAKERCQYEKDQVRAALRSDYAQLSTSCKTLLKKRTTLKCVLFSE